MRSHVSCLLLVVTFAGARSAAAQSQPMVVDHGPNVVVTLKNGAPVEGALITLDGTSVTLFVDRLARTIPLTAVTRIEREGEGSHDGALKGAAVLGLLCALVCGQGTTSGGEHLRVIASNAALGAVAGWTFDRGHRGRTRIYPPPGSPPGPPPSSEPPRRRHAVSVSPFGLAHGHGGIEYERRVASWLGVGLVAARTWRPSVWVGREQIAPDARQVLTDAVARVYPGGHVFSGAAFGLRAGVGTTADDRAFGIGYDLAYTWQLDARGYVSVGASQERAYASVRGRPTRVLWPLVRLNLGVVF